MMSNVPSYNSNDDSGGNETEEITREFRKPSAFRPLRKLVGHTSAINRIAWSPDNRLIATTSYDRTIRVWEWAAKGQMPPPRALVGHRDWVSSVAWLPDERQQILASAAGDNQIRIWNVATGDTLRAFTAANRTIFHLAWSPDGKILASASGDRSIALWSFPDFKLLHVVQGHAGSVYCVAWSPDGSELASGSSDKTIRIVDRATGKLKRVHENHAGAVYHLAYAPDGQLLASASQDSTIGLWGRQTGILEGHTDIVNSVSFSAEGHFLASKSLDGSVRVWRCDTWEAVKIFSELSASYWTASLAFHPEWPVLATLGDEDQAVRLWRFDALLLNTSTAAIPTVRYTNAKVVLVGESGVGKTSLAHALINNGFTATTSTHARIVTKFDSQEHVGAENEIREIFLWDLAGQATYRLIHQLHLTEVAVALLVFNAGSTNPFASIRYWNRALRLAYQIQGKDQPPLTIFLVAGRVDRGGIGVGRARVDKLMDDLQLNGYFETSALRGDNIPDLRSSIINAIPWDKLPKVSSTVLFQHIKNFLERIRRSHRSAHRVLFKADDLYETFLREPHLNFPEDGLRAQFDTCIGLVEARGLIRRLSFGKLVLLQPELLDAYASAIIMSAKDESDGMGIISKEKVVQGDFTMSDEERIPDTEQEHLLLVSTVEDLVAHEIALIDEDEHSTINLIFPSLSSQPHPDIPNPDNRTVIFAFEGPVANIYATLAVRLWNTNLFAHKDIYENAVFYEFHKGGACQLYLKPTEEDSKAELMLFFDEFVTSDMLTKVEEYTGLHLLRKATHVNRRKLCICPSCGEHIPDHLLEARRKKGFNWILCPVCETQITIGEEKPSTRQTFIRSALVQQMDMEADLQRDLQRERAILPGKIATEDFDVFICHNNRDKELVQQIAERLQENGILPWMDIRLNGGRPWEPELEKYIEKCKVFAFFVGKNRMGDFQRNELRFALDLGKRVIPTLLPDAPNDPRLLPLSLVDLQRVDFRKERPNPLNQLVRAILNRDLT